MIYIKSKNKIYSIDKAIDLYNTLDFDKINVMEYPYIKNLNLDVIDLKYYKFKALKRLINNALKLADIPDIDIYLDLKDRGINPLGQYIRRSRAKLRTLRRANYNPYIIIYLTRLFLNTRALARKKNKKGKYMSNRVIRFLKVLYHELIHHKQYVSYCNNLTYKRAGHNRLLPSMIEKNKIDTLRMTLKQNGV